MWFIGVEVEQETSAPPPKKNPGSAPAIIRSHATWYGERNTKYFLNLENSNKKKSCIRKLLMSDGEQTTDANVIYKWNIY